MKDEEDGVSVTFKRKRSKASRTREGGPTGDAHDAVSLPIVAPRPAQRPRLGTNFDEMVDSQLSKPERNNDSSALDGISTSFAAANASLALNSVEKLKESFIESKLQERRGVAASTDPGEDDAAKLDPQVAILRDIVRQFDTESESKHRADGVGFSDMHILSEVELPVDFREKNIEETERAVREKKPDQNPASHGRAHNSHSSGASDSRVLENFKKRLRK